MTPTERLLWAYRYGHSWNRDPKYANLRNLDSGRIGKMTGAEPDAKLLIGSWQDFDPNVNRLVRAFHRGRDVIPDGDWGPASEAVSRFARCGMPDFAPPAGAEMSMYDDIPELQEACKSYQKYAAYRNNDKEYSGTSGSWAPPAPGQAKTGKGSWPVGCDTTRKDVHSVVVGVSISGASAHQKKLMAEILRCVEETEAEIGQAVRHDTSGSASNPQHDVRFQNIPGSVIGFAYFPEPDECNQTTQCRIDNSFDADLFTMGELGSHEWKGHSDGLEHVNRTNAEESIMHPSIGNPSKRASWIKDRSFRFKQAYFGGEPIPPVNPPPPPPPPPPPGGEKFWLRMGSNYVGIMRNDTEVGQYIFVPK